MCNNTNHLKYEISNMQRYEKRMYGMRSFLDKKIKNILKKTINIKRISAITVMSIICLASVFSVFAFSRKVTIIDGENIFSLITINTNVKKILEQAGVEVGKNDTITSIEENDLSLELIVNRAFEVKVKVDDKEGIILNLTHENTVCDALIASGVEIEDNHFISHDLNTLLDPGMEIIVEKRVKIFITADGRTEEYSVPEDFSVLHAIIFADIPLYSEDVVSTDLNAKVSEGMSFSIERIGYRNSIVTEIIPFEKITKKTSLLDEGQTEIAVKGKNGEKEIFTKETIIDGKVVKSEKVKTRVSVSPVNEVILIGTRKSNQTVQVISPASDSDNKTSGNLTDNNSGVLIDSKGRTIEYKSKLTGKGTAYTAEEGAKTSTGKIASRGTVAVDPKIIPYGTKLYIKSADGKFVYGYAEAADTGGALRSGRVIVDLYMDTEKECFTFGRRDVIVYILK